MKNTEAEKSVGGRVKLSPDLRMGSCTRWLILDKFPVSSETWSSHLKMKARAFAAFLSSSSLDR